MVFNTALQGMARDAYEIFFWRKVPVWMRGLPIASGIAMASLALIYQPVKIEGNSMTPLLSNPEAISWIPEPYVLSQYEDLSDFGPIQVSSDSYFVLGDHRNSSNDSRVFGTVARRLIYGRAVFAYWPKDRFGSLSTRRTTEAKSDY